MTYTRKGNTVVLATRSFEPSPDSFPPDSVYWQRRAGAMEKMCADFIPMDELREMMYGNEIDTWKDLFDFCSTLYDQATQDADAEDLLDTQRCAQ